RGPRARKSERLNEQTASLSRGVRTTSVDPLPSFGYSPPPAAGSLPSRPRDVPFKSARRRRSMVWTLPSLSGRCPAALLLVLIALSGAGRVAAADKEVRDFTTFIDQKPAGNYRMTVTADDQGNVTMTGKAAIRLSIFRIKTYAYSYEGTEVWKDGRLIDFSSNSNDDGKKYTVRAVAERDGLRVTVNDQE